MVSETSSDSSDRSPHDPNPNPPSRNARFTLSIVNTQTVVITVSDLLELPRTTVHECLIVSTGHGTSGPFTFSGVALRDLVAAYVHGTVEWSHIEVVSGDGFSSRIVKQEIEKTKGEKSILIADSINSRSMTRDEGLVRLIVPEETEDALRQVKWIEMISVVNT